MLAFGASWRGEGGLLPGRCWGCRQQKIVPHGGPVSVTPALPCHHVHHGGNSDRGSPAQGAPRNVAPPRAGTQRGRGQRRHCATRMVLLPRQGCTAGEALGEQGGSPQLWHVPAGPTWSLMACQDQHSLGLTQVGHCPCCPPRDRDRNSDSDRERSCGEQGCPGTVDPALPTAPLLAALCAPGMGHPTCVSPLSHTQGHDDGRGSPHSQLLAHTGTHSLEGTCACSVDCTHTHACTYTRSMDCRHTQTHVSTPGRLGLHVHTHMQAACPAERARALLPLAGTGAPGREPAGKAPAAPAPPSLRHTAPADPPAVPCSAGMMQPWGQAAAPRTAPDTSAACGMLADTPEQCGVRGGFRTPGRTRAQAIAMGLWAWAESWVGSAARP